MSKSVSCKVVHELYKGFLYVLYSKSLNLVKVGYATVPNNRCKRLNKHSYAGVNDWEIQHTVKSEQMPTDENWCHGQLAQYSKLIQYQSIKQCTAQAKELFNCTVQQAIEVINNIDN
jgi:hypothetical protein